MVVAKEVKKAKLKNKYGRIITQVMKNIDQMEQKSERGIFPNGT